LLSRSDMEHYLAEKINIKGVEGMHKERGEEKKNI